MADKEEKFAGFMTQVLNYGSLNLALGMGYRLGLFEALAKFEGYASCDELAGEAGVSPRYLKEWLGVMACGGVVELTCDDDGQEAYRLPQEHAAYLLKGSKLNLGVYTQEIPLLTANAGDAVERSFKSGQGVGYERYPEFQDFMAELADAKHKSTLVETFLPSVDGGDMLKRLEAGSAVCDLGCGSGLAARLMAKAFPKSHITGMDFSPQAIDSAKQAAKAEALGNLSYVLEDAAAVAQKPEYAARYDYITAFDAIHDQSHPDKALMGVRHMLRSGGVFSMVDIAAESGHKGNLEHAMGPFLYTVSLMHCMPVGLNDNGHGLGMMWGKQLAVKMLEEAGFKEVKALEMDFDPFNLHFQCKR
jgi:2-polyprenyl-3-methyl-5-hydroxy-6-metoxy-1,4-benzoquinol methylase